MKRIILILLFSFYAFTYLCSQEFEVRSFRSDASDIAARVFQRKDVSNQYAAIIKVRTTLDGLKFESNLGLVGDPLNKENEIWLYVSPKEKRIKFMKDGFLPKDFFIKEVIESSSVYILELIKIGDVVEVKEVIVAPAPVVSTDLKSYGYILIQSEPAGAEVLVEGRKTGMKTPFQNSYTPGNYSFSLKKELFKDYTGSFKIDPNETSRMTVKLSPNFGILKISSEPEDGALIVLDEKVLRETTPLVIDSISSGYHSLTIQKEYYESQKLTVNIEPGKTETVKFDLKPTFGTIEIEAPEGSGIFIDKARIGTSSYKGRILSGSHILEIKKDSYSNFSETISIEIGKVYTMKPSLDPKVGLISIMTDPPDVSVYLNNEYKGKTPLIIKNIHIGTHNLRLSRASFGDIIRTIKVEENKTAECKETLINESKVKINSDPSGSQLKIDGNTVGTTPEILNLAIGKHNIVLTKDGFDEFKTDLTLSRESHSIKYRLLKTRRFRLQVKSKPSNAKVTIDGIKSGRTPITIPVSYGNHKIQLTKNRVYSLNRNCFVNQLKQDQFYQLTRNVKYRNKGRVSIAFLSGYVFHDIDGLHPNYGKKPAGWSQLIDIKLFTRNYKASFNLTPGFFRFWSSRSEDLLMIPLFLSFDFYISQVDTRKIGLFIGLGIGGLISIENQYITTSSYSYLDTKVKGIHKSALGFTARVGLSIRLSSKVRLEIGSYPYLLYGIKRSGSTMQLVVLNAGLRVNL